MPKSIIIILRIIVYLLVFAGIAIVSDYITSEYPFFVLYDANANIHVWLDTNGNGKRENNEPFLPNVCVWAGYAYEFQSFGGWPDICDRQYNLTDSSGAWYDFFAGGKCTEIYNAINPPDNYYPTTPTITKGCSAEFGLSQEKPPFEIESQNIGRYLKKVNQKETIIDSLKTGINIWLISVFAGFISFKIICLIETKKR